MLVPGLQDCCYTITLSHCLDVAVLLKCQCHIRSQVIESLNDYLDLHVSQEGQAIACESEMLLNFGLCVCAIKSLHCRTGSLRVVASTFGWLLHHIRQSGPKRLPVIGLAVKSGKSARERAGRTTVRPASDG